jgi:ABC-type nitrate/sulfonate/bicarbonate transport system substrate-binding protein
LKRFQTSREKKVGITRGTILEFYLGRYLDLHGISLGDVTLIDPQQPQYVDALVNDLTSEKIMHDYPVFIYTKGMEEVKPEAVNIR